MVTSVDSLAGALAATVKAPPVSLDTDLGRI